ncbi:MAG: hypothetical protein ACOYMB_00700 [Patescibacteria group bacterium]
MTNLLGKFFSGPKKSSAEEPVSEGDKKIEEIPTGNPENVAENELRLEEEKFKNNFEGLQNDIKDLGDEEEIADVLEKNPSVAKSFVIRAAKIAGAFTAFSVMMGASDIVTAFEAGDYKPLVIVLVVIVSISTFTSGFVELIKGPSGSLINNALEE